MENPHSWRDDELMKDSPRVPPKDSEIVYVVHVFMVSAGLYVRSVRLPSREALVDSIAKFIRAWEPKLS